MTQQQLLSPDEKLPKTFENLTIDGQHGFSALVTNHCINKEAMKDGEV